MNDRKWIACLLAAWLGLGASLSLCAADGGRAEGANAGGKRKDELKTLTPQERRAFLANQIEELKKKQVTSFFTEVDQKKLQQLENQLEREKRPSKESQLLDKPQKKREQHLTKPAKPAHNIIDSPKRRARQK